MPSLAIVSTATTVQIHPLVLLSATDHYNRVAKDTKKRVVGALLGQHKGKAINVANSFAVPFEEDEKDPAVWFLDHNYIKAMSDMFKKVNGKIKTGTHLSGPKLRSNDLEVSEIFKRYNPNPMLVIANVKPNDVEIPTDAYFSIEEIKDDGTAATKTFMYVPSEIVAEEAGEIGVEHLLRDIKDNAVGTLSMRIGGQLSSLSELQGRLEEIRDYFEKIDSCQLPVNYQIIYNLQDIFDLLPNLESQFMVQAFSTNKRPTVTDVFV
ncbi:maintenance of mitochondrial structure and function-domain-containing protein [Absidia repens]|uniref:Maintenance of mitochondrial structure and function-domain-containing protein n=1 Tax=Absidia repens TaxID=90262 RepID=A0A1X2IVP6_9FUNG|nr:maintenance of mitochondrial structure and function-domain-containing protein [Absidia repens]